MNYSSAFAQWERSRGLSRRKNRKLVNTRVIVEQMLKQLTVPAFEHRVIGTARSMSIAVAPQNSYRAITFPIDQWISFTRLAQLLQDARDRLDLQGKAGMTCS